MTDETISYARHFPVDDEPRNSKGQTLAEYIDSVKIVHATLKADLFHHMALKRKARTVVEMQVHDKRVAALSRRLADCRKIAIFYGIRLS